MTPKLTGFFKPVINDVVAPLSFSQSQIDVESETNSSVSITASYNANINIIKYHPHHSLKLRRV